MKKSYITVEKISLKYLNKAEFLGFLMRVIARLPEETAGGDTDDGGPVVQSNELTGLDALYISDELIQALQECIDKLSQITRETKSSVLTAELAEIDETRNSLVSYILSIVSQSINLPFEEQSQAAVSLYNALKVYNGANRLPLKQKTVVIKGMIIDSESEENAAHVETLGIKKHLDELKRLNDLYEEMTIARSDGNSVPSETTAELREQATLLYEELADRAFAANLLHGTEETKKFLLSLNQEIKDTKTAYNRRMAQGKVDDEDSGTSSPDDEVSGDDDKPDDGPVVQ